MGEVLWSHGVRAGVYEDIYGANRAQGVGGNEEPLSQW
jgi:hypothetical protein